ncbi:MAG: response regulator [bacterium]|nr:response regulator [bacterium]
MGEKKRVLIVEDDDLVKCSLARLLQGTDYSIETASSGEEGLELFQKLPYDLVLTDLRLPEMDGIEMISQMRKLDERLPFIVLSAYEEFEDALRAMKLGAVDFFQKPFNAQKILNLTRKYIRTCESQFAMHGDGLDSPEEIADMLVNKTLHPDSIPEVATSPPKINDVCSLLAPFVSLGQQFSGITHNLNGPLTGMMGHIELMKIRHPELDEDLDTVMKLAKKLRDNIAHLQTKYENETIREAQPQNINQILRAQTLFLQSDLFYKHYIERALELQDHLPNVKGVYADFALAFEQILINAIDAQKAKKAGTIKIRTYLKDNLIYVVFEDEGTGFSPEALERAFDPFWPEVRILEEGEVHLGLGLYLVKHWLEPYGAKIDIANNATTGARVCVTIPVLESKPK